MNSSETFIPKTKAMQKRTGKISASALGYAISFLLLTGLISSGVLFITATHKRIKYGFQLEEHMLMNNYLSLKIGAQTLKPGTRQIIHTSGDTTNVSVKIWGAYRAITATTFHGTRSVVKSAIVGSLPEDPLPALYLPDMKQSVKLCGSTRIEGKVFAPERGFERGHIAGSHYDGDKLIYGAQEKSERFLPGLKTSLETLDFEHLSAGTLKMESLPNDSSFSFNEKTTVWSTLEAIQLNQHLEGNLIIHSFDSIVVDASANLQHVILMAPIIRFSAGFKGKVQAIAQVSIHCEEGVHLEYPSALILNEVEAGTRDAEHGVFVEKDACVLGGILLRSDKPDFRHPVFLEVGDALIGGLIYNTGESEIRGEVVGSLHTQALSLRLGGGVYKGYFHDAKISSRKLPEDFVFPDWLKDMSNSKSLLLACF